MEAALSNLTYQAPAEFEGVALMKVLLRSAAQTVRTSTVLVWFCVAHHHVNLEEMVALSVRRSC